MTTLYTDRQQDILVIHKEISESLKKSVTVYTSLYMGTHDAKTSTNKYTTVKTFTDYIGFTNTVAKPLSLYHVLDNPASAVYYAYERIIHELKSDIKIRKGMNAGYRRYRLNEMDTYSIEDTPFASPKPLLEIRSLHRNNGA